MANPQDSFSTSQKLAFTSSKQKPAHEKLHAKQTSHKVSCSMWNYMNHQSWEIMLVAFVYIRSVLYSPPSNEIKEEKI